MGGVIRQILIEEKLFFNFLLLLFYKFCCFLFILFLLLFTSMVLDGLFVLAMKFDCYFSFDTKKGGGG